MLKYFAITVFCLALTGCYSAPDTVPAERLEGNYVLDPSHTSIIWRVSHAGLSNYTARFDKIEGTLIFDGNAPQNSRVDIRIDAASVNTGLPDFDETISADSRYFDSETYPEIAFTSTDISVTGDNTGYITGDLTFRGKSHPVTLDVIYNGAGKSFGHPGETLGFSATGTLNRSDFGLTHLTNFGIGDVVELVIETEFNERQ